MTSGRPRFPSPEALQAAVGAEISANQPGLERVRRLSALGGEWLSDVLTGALADVQPAVDCLNLALSLDPASKPVGLWLQIRANLLLCELLRAPADETTLDAMLREFVALETVSEGMQEEVSPSVWNAMSSAARRLTAAGRIQYARLLAIVDRALRAAEAVGDPGDFGRALLNAGNAKSNDPRHTPETSARLAYPFYRRAVTQAIRAKDGQLEARCRYAAGLALINRFDFATEADFTRASHHLARACDLFEAFGAEGDWGDAIAGLASLYISDRARHIVISDERYRSLLEHLEIAVAKNPAHIRPEARAVALLCLAQVARKAAVTVQAREEVWGEQLQRREAEAAFEARDLAADGTDLRLWARAETAVGQALLSENGPESLDQAFPHFLIGAALLGEDHAIDRLRLWRSYGLACMRCGRWQTAAATFNNAVSFASSQPWRNQMTLELAGELSECLSCKAYCELKFEQVRSALNTLEYGRQLLMATPHPPLDFEAICVRLKGTCVLVPVLTPLSAAVVAILPDDGQLTLKVIELPEFEGMNAGLHPQYFPSHAGWLGWLSTWRQDRSQQASQLRRDGLDTLIGELSKQFLRPILSSVESMPQHLVLVGHTGLQVLPMHAALASLAEGARYTFAFASSLHAFAQSQIEFDFADASLLAVGLSRYRDARLRRIPLAEEEARQAVLQLGSASSRALTAKEATRARVLTEAPEFEIVHLACHGTWNRDPDESALQLWPPGNRRASRLTARSIRRSLHLRRARLVVLSACDSGVVEHLFAPNELSGLLGALLRAGTPQVICSLWAVHDVASLLLWVRFYQMLKVGLKTHDALAHSQLHLRELSAARVRSFAVETSLGEPETARILTAVEGLPEDARPFEHPIYWAPFVLFEV